MALLRSATRSPFAPLATAVVPPLRSTLHRSLRLARAVALFVLATAFAPAASVTTAKEYQIKALFLFNFLQFTEWPATAFAGPEAPLRIGLLGDNPFGDALAAVLKGEKVRQRPLQLEHSRRPQDLFDCHLVFVSESERGQLPAIIAAFAGRQILTVGDMPDFARRGGTINFYFEDQKVRFDINRATAQASALKLSSQLLSLARIVGPPPEKGAR